MMHSGVGYTRPRIVPQEAELQRAAEVLNAGKKVAILVGAGALHATEEVIAVADRLQAGAAKALLGKAVLPDDLPWVTGGHLRKPRSIKTKSIYFRGVERRNL